MMRIHVLQHDPNEGEGNIRLWARARGHRIRHTRLDRGEPLPDLSNVDFLIVMGGPMNVDEHTAYPWLAPEKELIAAAIASECRVLGICLGAQLIARALGAEVTRNPQPEIGWFPVTLTPAARRQFAFQRLPWRFTPLHWHGDTFAIPRGAIHIAQSRACAHQAFTYKNHVIALQFHIEYGLEHMRLIAAGTEKEPAPGPFIQPFRDILAARSRCHAQRQYLFTLLDAFAG